jgi:hypothetical protein
MSSEKSVVAMPGYVILYTAKAALNRKKALFTKQLDLNLRKS